MPKLPGAAHAGKPRGRRAIAALAAALVATSLGAVCALAQKWPERSITLIVPFAAGGASDVSSRIMADVMSKHLGQTIIIENSAGAGGATGSLRGKNAQPDGYTIGFGHMGTHAAALVVTSLGAVCALAQKWPERSITLIVPFAAGGASDVSSRIMADVMSKHLGQTIIIENSAGAGGATGSLRGKNAQPDGYTIGFGHMGTHAAAVATNPKLPYDPRTDFDYLGIHLVTPHIMIVRKDFPADTLQEFVAYARAKGKDLKMGHNGVGSLAHLTCLFFFQLAGVEPTYVVYRGFGQTINDILSGAIDGTCELIASAREHVIGGTVKGFVVATPERTPLLPDVPTSKEGGMPEFVMESWLGLYAPKGLPPPILAKLREAAVAALEDPLVQKRFPEIGGSVPKKEDRGGDRMLEIIKSDVVRWGEVVKKAGGMEAKQ